MSGLTPPGPPQPDEAGLRPSEPYLQQPLGHAANPYANTHLGQIRSMPPYDGYAVASAIVVLTCIGGPVAVWLGIRGVRATAAGRRSGAWCAWVGVIGGVLVTLALVAGIVGAATLRDHFRTVTAVATGDCVDQYPREDDDGEPAVDFILRNCYADHEAEIVHQAELTTATAVAEFRASTPSAWCGQFLSPAQRRAAQTGNYLLQTVASGDTDGPDVGDAVACVMQHQTTYLKAPIGRAP